MILLNVYFTAVRPNEHKMSEHENSKYLMTSRLASNCLIYGIADAYLIKFLSHEVGGRVDITFKLKIGYIASAVECKQTDEVATRICFAYEH